MYLTVDSDFSLWLNEMFGPVLEPECIFKVILFMLRRAYQLVQLNYHGEQGDTQHAGFGGGEAKVSSEKCRANSTNYKMLTFSLYSVVFVF